MSLTTPAARRDLSFHLHPSTNLRSVQAEGPLVITRGEGVYVYDDEGRRYLEGMAGLWCASLGFSERRLAEAAYKQMCELPFYHSFGGKVPAISTELAERLIGIARREWPRYCSRTRVRGERHGDQARLVRQQRARPAAEEEDHLAAARVPRGHHRQWEPHRARLCPHRFRLADRAHPAHRLPVSLSWRTAGRERGGVRCAARRESRAADLHEGPDTVAAFFAEPVMGAGGVIVPPATYFDRVQPILKKYDILFVVDEVICGFGRTGHMFGSQTFNLQPDIITLAKALSAGYVPISANLVSGKLYEILLAQSDKLGIFGHGYTYSSHPVPAAVALETLKIYDEIDILAQVRRVGPRMQAGIRGYADHPLIGEARGIGLIGAVEIVRDKATKQSFDPKAGVAAFLVRRAQHHGAILRNMPGDIVAFSPPLIISEAEIDEMLACFGKALDDTWAMVKEKGLA
jgi:4-aminobutyrate--pyruvate transaminase